MINESFNEACKNISADYLKVGDESMNAIRFWTTAKGNLPNFSYIVRKMEPLLKEFKTVAYYTTGGLVFIKGQTRNERMNNRNYHLQLGENVFRTNRITVAKKG